MDPLSITLGCVTHIGTITKLSVSISAFVHEVRSARIELDDVARELLSLKTILELLQEDLSDTTSTSIPVTLRVQTMRVISNCNTVAIEIENVLEKHSGSRIDKSVKWTLFGKGDVSKLRLSLEAHKSALEIALDMVTL
jgi:hypothetical protein